MLGRLVDTQTALDLLYQERNSLKAVCETLETSLAHSRSAYTRQSLAVFPPELLGKIFLAIQFESMDVWFDQQCWGQRVSPRVACKKWTQLPLRLAAVCRLWRAVTLDEGRLWAYLAVTASADFEAHALTQTAERISIYLLRSKATPLHVSIEYDELSEDYHVIASSILTKLGQHVHRIQYCDIHADSSFAELAYSVFKTACPALVAGYFNLASEEDIEQITGCFPFTPRLRTLQLHGDCIPTLADHTDGIASVVTLSVCSIITDNMNRLPLYLRRWGQSIERLAINIFGGELENWTQFHLPSLQELRFRECLFFPRLQNAGPSLVAPNLTHLSLDDVALFEEDVIFVTGIATSVTHLSLSNSGDLSVLGLLRGITHLTLGVERLDKETSYHSVIDDQMFLTLCDQTPPVWPKLVSICLAPTIKIAPTEAPNLLRFVRIRGPRGQNPTGAQDVTASFAVLLHLEINCKDAQIWLVKEAARLMQPAA